jgi:5-methylcytosine-specific restriction protein A
MRPRLTTLKPRLQMATPRVQTAKAGDARIRGSALQTIRERILTRDCWLCQCARCKTTGSLKVATIVDHTTPLWAGGRESDSNRQSINADCHDAKSAHEARCRAAGSWEPWQGS